LTESFDDGGFFVSPTRFCMEPAVPELCRWAGLVIIISYLLYPHNNAVLAQVRGG
jgi:hypothetical protein